MIIRSLASVIIGVILAFLLAFIYNFIAIAAIDAPHNESNNVYCGSCHGEGLLQSFWGGSGLYSTFDELCLSCHKASSGPYSETNAPLVKTHSSENTSNKYGEWSKECRNCHNPHYQKQKNYKNTDANDLYLATGTITDCVYNGDGTSTLTYSSITYKTGWDASKIIDKTEKGGNDKRSGVFFPNVKKLGYCYPIIGIDEVAKTITVKGNATPVYQYISSSTFAIMYGQYIRDYIDGNLVKFFDRRGSNSFADGVGAYSGVCEICHTQTDHFRNDGNAPDQNHSNLGGKDGTNCSYCHNHTKGFGHGGDCTQCHGHEDGWLGGDYSGTTISHSTHTENDDDDVKGPYMVCSDCHDTNNYPYFNSGTDSNGDGKYDLSETDVCDTCHSPGGSFNGLISQGASIGAKTNWKDGVYQSDSNLASGKEKWCAGCHDDAPAVVDGKTAPDICGDNSSYGYYIGAHGNGTYGVNHNSRSYTIGECVNCHSTDNISGTSSHGGQLFATNNADFCFQCHKGSGTIQVGGITNYMYSKTFGGESANHGITNVYAAFTASGSSHDLNAVRTYAEGKGWGITDSTNQCLICHNVHYARANKRSPQDPTQTAIRRASQFSSNPKNLWGDSTSERMNSVWSRYQAPRYTSSGYEPGGTSSTNGSKHPDYAIFCLDCHSSSVNGLTALDWSTTGNPQNYKPYHGENWQPSYGSVGIRYPRSPYSKNTKYVLSCLDCHEPHGSTNKRLLRTEVNNISGLSFTTNPTSGTTTEWNNFCDTTCHNRGSHWGSSCWTSNCHPHGAKHSI